MAFQQNFNENITKIVWKVGSAFIVVRTERWANFHGVSDEDGPRIYFTNMAFADVQALPGGGYGDPGSGNYDYPYTHINDARMRNIYPPVNPSAPDQENDPPHHPLTKDEKKEIIWWGGSEQIDHPGFGGPVGAAPNGLQPDQHIFDIVVFNTQPLLKKLKDLNPADPGLVSFVLQTSALAGPTVTPPGPSTTLYYIWGNGLPPAGFDSWPGQDDHYTTPTPTDADSNGGLKPFYLANSGWSYGDDQGVIVYVGLFIEGMRDTWANLPNKDGLPLPPSDFQFSGLTWNNPDTPNAILSWFNGVFAGANPSLSSYGLSVRTLTIAGTPGHTEAAKEQHAKIIVELYDKEPTGGFVVNSANVPQWDTTKAKNQDTFEYGGVAPLSVHHFLVAWSKLTGLIASIID